MSKRGLQQAEALANYYCNIDFGFIYSSDLSRAVDTAKAILNKRDQIELKQEVDLRERKFGIFEGLTSTEAEEQYPVAYQTWTSGSFDFKTKGGESRRELLARSKSKLEEIAARHIGDYGIIVVHGGLLSTFWRHLDPYRAKNEGFRIPNASIAELIYENGEWEVLSWSKIDHLKGIEALSDDTVEGVQTKP